MWHSADSGRFNDQSLMINSWAQKATAFSAKDSCIFNEGHLTKSGSYKRLLENHFKEACR